MQKHIKTMPFLKKQPVMTNSGSMGFEPIQLLEVDIAQPLADLPGVDSRTDHAYRRGRVLVRLHTRPLGLVDLRLAEGGVSARDLASQIWNALGQQINEHLRQDNLPEISTLTASGIAEPGTPRCRQAHQRLLANAPFVSIVIPTRDRPDRIAASLRLLLAQDYPEYEIIVVDNAPSTNATADLIKQSYGAKVRYLREERPGNSWARNVGLAEARGEIIAFLDDDVIFDAHWLAELVMAFEIAADVACVTGMILPVELETPAQMWIEQYGGFAKGFTRRIFDMGENRPRDPLFPYTAGAFGSGANMAFRTPVLRSIGGFDPAIGGGSVAYGGEDLAAFFKVVRGGYKLVYEPAAIVRHPHHREYARLRQQVYGYGAGLTAYLTKCLFDDPKLLIEFAVKIPYGLFFIFSARSSKNSKKLSDYPRELTYIERKGMLYGPLAYLRGRWRRHRLSRAAEAPPSVALTVDRTSPSSDTA